MLNLFGLHGKYFRDDENRFTAMVLCLLSECRGSFLRAFLANIGADEERINLPQVRISFQPHYDSDAGGIDVPDAVIEYGGELYVLIEAKIGRACLSKSQLLAYASHLAERFEHRKRLICITQVSDRENFESIKPALLATGLKPSTVVYRQWYEILDLLRESVGLSADIAARLDSRVRQAKKVGYEHRLSHLFLKEVEDTMYMKRDVDMLPAGELDDIVIVTQDPWFMDVVHKHGVWFPSGSLKHGLRPTKYVAFYETSKEGNQNPKHISYMARNRVFWNRITVPEARSQPELGKLFADAPIAKVIASWREPHDTFHIALAETPVRLRSPIPLGKKNYAQILVKRRYSLPSFLNAQTIDDLF